MDPNWGPQFVFYIRKEFNFRTLFLRCGTVFHETKAIAVWKWANFLHGNVSPTERAVVVNMDETSVRLYQNPGKGYLVKLAREKKTQSQIADKRCFETSSIGNFHVCGHDMRRRRLAAAHSTDLVHQTPDLAGGVRQPRGQLAAKRDSVQSR